VCMRVCLCVYIFYILSVCVPKYVYMSVCKCVCACVRAMTYIREVQHWYEINKSHKDVGSCFPRDRVIKSNREQQGFWMDRERGRVRRRERKGERECKNEGEGGRESERGG
jgi:hypothetical protein